MRSNDDRSNCSFKVILVLVHSSSHIGTYSIEGRQNIDGWLLIAGRRIAKIGKSALEYDSVLEVLDELTSYRRVERHRDQAVVGVLSEEDRFWRCQRSEEAEGSRAIRSFSANIAAQGSSAARTTKSARDLRTDRAVPIEARGAARERVAKKGSRRSKRSKTTKERQGKGITTVDVSTRTAKRTAIKTKGADEECTKYCGRDVHRASAGYVDHAWQQGCRGRQPCGKTRDLVGGEGFVTTKAWG